MNDLPYDCIRIIYKYYGYKGGTFDVPYSEEEKKDIKSWDIERGKSIEYDPSYCLRLINKDWYYAYKDFGFYMDDCEIPILIKACHNVRGTHMDITLHDVNEYQFKTNGYLQSVTICLEGYFYKDGDITILMERFTNTLTLKIRDLSPNTMDQLVMVIHWIRCNNLIIDIGLGGEEYPDNFVFEKAKSLNNLTVNNLSFTYELNEGSYNDEEGYGYELRYLVSRTHIERQKQIITMIITSCTYNCLTIYGLSEDAKFHSEIISHIINNGKDNTVLALADMYLCDVLKGFKGGNSSNFKKIIDYNLWVDNYHDNNDIPEITKKYPPPNHRHYRDMYDIWCRNTMLVLCEQYGVELEFD